MDEDFMRGVVIVAGALGFGYWVESFWAGLFAFAVINLLDTAAENLKKG